MNYLSVCSGIEAASVAWHPLGWKPVAFSEIEPFPSAVLAHRFPETPNWGDMTKFKEWPDANVDVLVGGTPCQSFSVAGLRKGLDDPRGNLALTYLAIAERYRPRWILWENVPGVLSSNGGRDFGSFLGGLGKLGYGFAYRVLDAQFVRTFSRPHAVPQRRRRVFVVGYSGDWRPPAAVLIERESMCRNPPPRRKAGQGIAADAAGSTRSGSHWDGSGVHPSLNQSHNTGGIGASNQEIFSQRGAGLVAARMVAFGEYEVDGTASAMKARDYKDATDLVAHTLKGEGHDASENGTGRGVPLVPVAYGMTTAMTPKVGENVSPTLMLPSDNGGGQVTAVAAPIPFDLNQITSRTNRSQPSSEVHHTLPATALPPHLASPWAVRRLSPVECERLQGFPDSWTDVPYRNRRAADGPRYKALGNSMAVNCMEYIGRRIALVEGIIKEQQKGQHE